MKTNAHSLTLLSGLLLAAPTFAQASSSSATDIVTLAEQGTLFVSSSTFTARGALGMSRQVLLAVRIKKNTNTNGYRNCDALEQADSVTIEVLDDKTKAVLGVAKRMFGNLAQGENNLFRESSTYGCIPDQKSLSLNGSTLTLSDVNGLSSALTIDGFATVDLPARLTLRK